MAMKIFLMRHAHAVDGFPDPQRPLSEEGESMAEAMAAFMRHRAFYDFEAIWASPFQRAWDTAEIVRRSMKIDAPIARCEALVPEADPRKIRDALKGIRTSLLLVGHNPHMSLLTRMLLGGDGNLPRMPFKKAAVLAMDGIPGSSPAFTLASYITPKSLGL
jgi:phosphohistidine phosphatase